MVKRRRQLTPLEAHEQWLGGRMPSEALGDYARDVEDSPLAKWLKARDNRNRLRKRSKRRR